MREPGEAPMFNHIIDEVTRARAQWNLGNLGNAECILRAVASIAYGESRERKPTPPGPITWLHKRAAEMNDPPAKAILNGAAFNIGVEAARALGQGESGDKP